MPPDTNTPMPPYANTPTPGRSLIKILFTGIVGIVNIGVLLIVGFVGLFILQQQAHPNPGGILLIALLPLAGIAIIVGSVLNSVCLVAYLRSSRVKSSRSKAAARIGLIVCLAVLGLVVFDFCFQVSSIKQMNSDENRQRGVEFQSVKDRAGSQYAFDILIPKYLPKGYAWGYGQVAGTGQPESIYFDSSYRNRGNSFDFDIIDFSKRPTYNPPTSCGDYMEPFDRSDPDKLYPCQLVGHTASGRDVYYYPIPSTGPGNVAQEAYFVEYGNNVATMSFVKDPAAPTRAEVFKILDSLAPSTIDDVVRKNTAAGM